MVLPEHDGEQQREQSPNEPETSDLETNLEAIAPMSDQARADLQAYQEDLVAQLTGVVTQLTTDIDRLEQEKAGLLEATHDLRAEQQGLQEHQRASLQQQQQQWAKQLAQALANRLYVLLVQKLEAAPSLTTDTNQAPGALSRATEQQLQQMLSRYEGAMVERLGRMTQLEQRGEALLEALVSRIEAQTALATQGGTSASEAEAARTQALVQQLAAAQGRPVSSFKPSATAKPNVAPGSTPGVSSRTKGLNFNIMALPQAGLIFILLSTLALSLHNVAVGIIGVPSSLFNIWELGGFIELKSLDSSLLILWLRMIFVAPLMAAIAGFLYPATWRDLRGFASSRDRQLLRNVCGSGAFLFISQVLIYIAIGQIGPGIAVTILFMYPIITVPLAWLLFGDRPTPLRIGVMAALSLGVVLAALPTLSMTGGLSFLGVGAAVLSGVAFAFYLISMQLSFRRLHPVPVSVIQFFTIFLLTSLILLFRPVEIVPGSPIGLFIGGFVLGGLTLMGYLFNNFGVRLMGAARASIVASSGPVLTALLAFVITPGPNTVLKGVQVLGILIVTLGITALALERLLAQQAAKRKQQAAS